MQLYHAHTHTHSSSVRAIEPRELMSRQSINGPLALCWKWSMASGESWWGQGRRTHKHTHTALGSSEKGSTYTHVKQWYSNSSSCIKVIWFRSTDNPMRSWALARQNFFLYQIFVKCYKRQLLYLNHGQVNIHFWHTSVRSLLGLLFSGLFPHTVCTRRPRDRDANSSLRVTFKLYFIQTVFYQCAHIHVCNETRH